MPEKRVSVSSTKDYTLKSGQTGKTVSDGAGMSLSKLAPVPRLPCAKDSSHTRACRISVAEQSTGQAGEGHPREGRHEN